MGLRIGLCLNKLTNLKRFFKLCVKYQKKTTIKKKETKRKEECGNAAVIPC